MKTSKARECVCLIRGIGSFLLVGDPQREQKEFVGGAIPTMLEDGWRVKSVHIVPNPAESNPSDAVMGYVVLEK
jgi:hypothetical protein